MLRARAVKLALLPVASLGITGGITGCLRHTRVLEKPLPASVVQTATAEQLIQQIKSEAHVEAYLISGGKETLIDF